MNRWDGKPVKDWGIYLNSRCIVIGHSFLSDATEVKVLEVSPKGRVKLQFPSGYNSWEDREEYLLIEELHN